MMKFDRVCMAIYMVTSCMCIQAARTERMLENGWRFHLGDVVGAELVNYDDSRWQIVNIPHDWAISGPFSRDNDLQEVRVIQDLEKKASVKTGRTGGLPYMGVGWYRLWFHADSGRHTELLFDGAMSEPQVYVNGTKAGEWKNGYNAFSVDISSLLSSSGTNLLAVRLENPPYSSRWYPGAGLYRNVHLITTDKIHIPIWGVSVTTPHITDAYAIVNIDTEVCDVFDSLRLETDIYDNNGIKVSSSTNSYLNGKAQHFKQVATIEHPDLWSPETPSLYKAIIRVYVADKLVDEHSESFGIRNIDYIPEKGFYLNGQNRKIHGVCLHHDLGPLGTAVNESALRHRLAMLKEMGCDAIRSTHNTPEPELVRLCDEMGLMMLIEPFDEWDTPKCTNGYHRFFSEWMEQDLRNMIRHYRNHPCVVMWGIGNEVPNQTSKDGWRLVERMQQICHEEDGTRPVTCCMDQVITVLSNGFAENVDIPGINYNTWNYDKARAIWSQGLILGSETASTVSSRNVYKFPVKMKANAQYDDHQSSGYDVEYCPWSNVPDVDFALEEDNPWYVGQFVWTGFDYLGEPTPYNNDAWPSHSSLFGIIDLASLPKDRYWLYRSVWRKDVHTLHIVPHWTFPDRVGKVTPVMVYTDSPLAELFLNGRSLGVRKKTKGQYGQKAFNDNNLNSLDRYRLVWNDVIYEPGELKVIAYNEDGSMVGEKIIRTAGKPHHINLTCSRKNILASSKELVYITVNIVDKDGNLCPDDTRKVTVKVRGVGKNIAMANGDPTCLEPFDGKKMSCFGGQLTTIVGSNGMPGNIEITCFADGVRPGSLTIKTEFPIE